MYIYTYQNREERVFLKNTYYDTNVIRITIRARKSYVVSLCVCKKIKYIYIYDFYK